jgi:hypothetical protein
LLSKGRGPFYAINVSGLQLVEVIKEPAGRLHGFSFIAFVTKRNQSPKVNSYRNVLIIRKLKS